jgi:hypothetical protein
MKISSATLGRTALLAGMTVAGLSAASVAAPQTTAGMVMTSTQEAVVRVYRVNHLDLRDAALLAHQLCLNTYSEDACEYSIQGQHWFEYATYVDMQEKIAALLEEHDVAPPTFNLRVILLVADNTQRPEPELSASEARALADVRQFLPYKGYRLLESGWVRTKNQAEVRLGKDPLYLAHVDIRGERSPGDRSIPVRRFSLTTEEPVPEMGDPEAPKVGFRSLEILSTSFTMNIGETVVVGTSKLNGDDEALVVLLTAAE